MSRVFAVLLAAAALCAGCGGSGTPTGTTLTSLLKRPGPDVALTGFNITEPPPAGVTVLKRNAGNTGFADQVFFNPTAVQVGNLPVMTFDGPSQYRIDLALSKRIRFTDKHRIEVKGEAFNRTNTPSFFIGDMDINSTTFGRLTSVNVGSRVVQLSIRFDF